MWLLPVPLLLLLLLLLRLFPLLLVVPVLLRLFQFLLLLLLLLLWSSLIHTGKGPNGEQGQQHQAGRPQLQLQQTRHNSPQLRNAQGLG
jgi:hypothetical protein